MSQVLIDNWTLERAFTNINDVNEGISEPSNEYASLIEAMLLWDKISYLDTSFSAFWCNRISFSNQNSFFKPVAPPDIYPYESLLVGEKHGIIAQGAIEYWKISQRLGINFILTDERADFLSRYPPYRESLSRLNIARFVDEELEKYYKDINAKLGKNFIKFQFPALFDYVRANTSNSKDYFKTACEIRNDRDIARFRSWLQKFDESINSGNIQKVNEILSYISTIITDIDRRFQSKQKVQLQIGLSPGIALDASTISRSGVSTLFNLSFLRKLVKSSVFNRPFM